MIISQTQLFISTYSPSVNVHSPIHFPGVNDYFSIVNVPREWLFPRWVIDCSPDVNEGSHLFPSVNDPPHSFPSVNDYFHRNC